MILRASDVVDLQFFLMDCAKRYCVDDSGTRSPVADVLLESAAALDYALLLSSESGDEPLDAAAPVARSVCETMTLAASRALDFAADFAELPGPAFADFSERNLRSGGIFDTLRSLKENGAVTAPDVAFRALTVANDLIERRRREGA